MASTTYKTITIQAEAQVRREAQASVALTPGELLEWSGGKLIPHGTAGGMLKGGKLVCLETQHPDSDLSATIDVDYVADDTVYFTHAKPGDVYNMFLAAGESATAGVSVLQSDGAGALAVQATLDATLIEGSVVGVAENTVDNSGGGTRVRIRVRII